MMSKLIDEYSWSKKMFEFENLRVKNIQILLLAIQQANIRDYSYIQRIYSQSCENFDTTLAFLIEVGILLIEDKSITISPQSLVFLNIHANSAQPLDILRSFLIKQILDKHNACSSSVYDFLSRFTLHENAAIFIPDSGENLRFASYEIFLSIWN